MHAMYWGIFCESVSTEPYAKYDGVQSLASCAFKCYQSIAYCRAFSYRQSSCFIYDIFTAKVFSICSEGDGPTNEATFFARYEMNEDVKKLENAALFSPVKSAVGELDPAEIPKKDLLCFNSPVPESLTDGHVRYDLDIFQDRNCEDYEGYYATYPWISVDLRKEYAIIEIIIYNLGHGYESLLHDIELRVGTTDIADMPDNFESLFLENPLCASVEGELAAGPNVFTCKEHLSGRFVSLQITAECSGCKYSFNKIAISEIEVWVFRPPSEINRAFLKPTKMSSQSENFVSSLSVDGYKSLTHRDRGRPMLTSTAGKDPAERPWFQVDLKDSFKIKEIIIYVPDIGHHGIMHDVEIQVGLEDIGGSSPYKPLYYSPSRQDCRCFHDRILTEGQTVVTCRKEFFGRFVSVQITQNCSLIVCSTYNNRIVLSEIEVIGSNYKSYTDPSVISYLKPAEQSTTVALHPASLAVDGKLENKPQVCTRTTADDPYPWWRVDLIMEYIILAVSVLNLETQDKTMLLHDLTIQAGYYDMKLFPANIRFTKNEDCVNLQGPLTRGWNEYECDHPVRGEYVNVQIVLLCNVTGCPPGNKNVLSLCELAVTGSPLPVLTQILKHELAYYSEATQSSHHARELNASLTVDGLTDVVITDKSVPVCASTTENPNADNYPWWRIDMFHERIVYQVDIYNRGDEKHNLLHDFEIRVGMEDIANIPENTVFNMNAICATQRRIYITGGALSYMCESPLLGRYVSIQIVEFCRDTFCGSQSYNVLSLCEVFVWGVKSPMGTDTELRNEAVFRPTAQSSTIFGAESDLAVDGIMSSTMWSGVEFKCATTNTDIENVNPWWRVDLVYQVDVSAVEIANAGSAPGMAFHDAVIRVGDEDIAHFPPNTEFIQNEVCVYLENLLKPGSEIFTCYKVLTGRFVSVQITKPCNYRNCPTTSMDAGNVLSLCEVAVWGKRAKLIYDIAIREMKIDTAMDKFALTSSTITSSHFANDCPFPIINETITIGYNCAMTSREPYPWWMVDLGGVYVVYGLRVTIPKIVNAEEYTPRIAVRVGHWLIALEPLGKPFNQNQLCGELRYELFTDEKRKINCVTPLIGQYVSLQVLSMCPDPENCSRKREPFLIICGIQIASKQYIPY